MTKSFWIKRFSTFFVAALVFSLLFGASNALRAQVPQRGGTLTVAVDLEPASLDPAFSNASTDRRVFNLYVENLLYQDEKGKFLPALAESWDS